MTFPIRPMTLGALCCLPLFLAACGGNRHSPDTLECMTRAMYFESNRSSRDGMVAVGTVVMNRVASDAFPNTVCGVVGQKNQFAPGVMTKPMTEQASLARAIEAADSVLKGERHPGVQKSRFFHAASYRANYNNMHYVLTTGGNAFYEKRRPELVTQPRPVAATEGVTGSGTVVTMNQATVQPKRGLLRRIFGG